MTHRGVDGLSLSPLHRLARLKLELAEAVKSELFEQAATIRDQIRQLERELTRRPSGVTPNNE